MGAIETTEDRQECRLAASRRTRDRDELAGTHIETDTIEDGERTLRRRVRVPEALDGDRDRMAIGDLGRCRPTRHATTVPGRAIELLSGIEETSGLKA